MNKTFAERLKMEREKRGWKQDHLADLIGVTNGAISGYERNYREPDFETLTKLAEIFNVSTDYLLGKEPIIGALRQTESGLEQVDISKLSPSDQETIRNLVKSLIKNK